MRPLALRLAAVLIALAMGAGPARLAAQPLVAPPGRDLAYIESLYQAREAFRAETEMLRFLAAHPESAQRNEVELARAKLYYREGRLGEATVMAISLFDRAPRTAAGRDAERLLALALIRQGRLAEAGARLGALASAGEPAPSLEVLRGAPPGALDPERAVAWSTWLPGAGFLLLDQPAKAATALTLNLALLGGAALAYLQDNPGAALALLLIEIALYRGGREAVREAAGEVNRRLDRERVESWARRHGEGELLAVGFRIAFGGP
ncbi:MAG: hypothetical protein HY423_11650 [Candidatus Lambdaproteobacteria bacterium]|nr:hypothetical protein [Candidatus Lambdaproteobacteria bacterium]